MAFPFLTGLLTRIPGLDRVRTSFSTMGQPVLLTSLAVTGFIVGLRTLGVFERPELALYDQFIRFQPEPPPDNRLMVVGIDEVDLQTLKEWPITDGTLAKAIENLQAHEPRIIGIDILRDIPVGTERERLLNQLQQKNVVIVCKANSADEPGVPPPEELSSQNVVAADVVIDSGGILRRSLLYLSPPPSSNPLVTPHLCSKPGTTLVTLGFGTALAYLQATGLSYSFDEQNQLSIGSVKFPALTPNFGGYRGVDAAGYQLMLRYRSEDNVAPVVSLTDVLEGRVSDDLIRDRIVLIGYTTSLAKDDFYTPFSGARNDQQKMDGVVIHAQSASQILSVALDGRSLISPWPLPLEILWIFSWALVTGVFAWYGRHPAWFVSGVIVFSATAYGISLLLFIHGTWIPLFPAFAAILLTAVGVVLFDRFYNSAYGQKVVKQVKTFLHIDIDEEKLGKQVSEITETDYFQDLKNAVKSLRSEPSDAPALPTPPPNININSAETSKVTLFPIARSDRADVESSPLESAHSPFKEQPRNQPGLDPQSMINTALGDLTPPLAEPPYPKLDLVLDGSDDELDFLADLNKEARHMKQKAEPTQDSTSDGLDFLADLNKEAQQLKNKGDSDS